ncbi:cell division/cell wall cluster transcriptional repressor MraZ [Amaricoccus sp.]|uniref:division/cell wall cluster transcriptional repressor MraZ n=1 Tax=Amaricoccus sp. TaxID=1872485 RepID=UPI003459C3D8
MSIPAPFRRVLEEGDPDWVAGAAANLVVLFGRTDKARLECFTLRAIEAIDDLIETYAPLSDEREDLTEILNAQSVYAALDETGRIVLSQRLRDEARIGDEAVFLGMGDSFHIWSPEGYAAHVAERARRRAEGPDVSTLLGRARAQRPGGEA